MDYVPILEEQAKQRGLAFTPLTHIQKLSQSDKVACCGGSVVRVVTESSSDSTVAIQDGPNGMCYCAIHGDVTGRYPDVLTPGALLLLTNVTALILSSSVAPLLIVCTDNVAGLALPQETYPHSSRSSARASGFTVPEPQKKEPQPDSMIVRADDVTEGGGERARESMAQPVHHAAPQVAPTAVHDAMAGVADTSSEDEDGLELADDL